MTTNIIQNYQHHLAQASFEFEKTRTENAKFKIENTKLKKDIDQLKNTLSDANKAAQQFADAAETLRIEVGRLEASHLYQSGKIKSQEEKYEVTQLEIQRLKQDNSQLTTINSNLQQKIQEDITKAAQELIKLAKQDMDRKIAKEKEKVAKAKNEAQAANGEKENLLKYKLWYQQMPPPPS